MNRGVKKSDHGQNSVSLEWNHLVFGSLNQMMKVQNAQNMIGYV